MQSVAEGFTAEERDSTRSIAHNLLVSWKKDTNLAAITFTIGVSMIGGDDLIGINNGAIGSPSNYLYFDESDYVMSMSWERGLNMPTGGLSRAMGEATLDNTTGRYTPRYMGGSSELFTAILPRRPFIINSGYNYNGVDQVLPQMTGVTTKQVDVDQKNKRVKIQGDDYLNFFQNRYLDQTIMFTGQTTDVVMETLLSQLGMSTAQYSLDTGINVIPFGIFNKGDRFSDMFAELAEAENGHFYQDEQGKFRFENRQHWGSSPYNQVQKIVLTGQVINAQAPTTDHIINAVEIKAQVRTKQPLQTIFRLSPLSSIRVPSNSSYEQFFEFDDPVLSLTDPTYGGTYSFFLSNSKSDGTGTNNSANLSVRNVGTFAQNVKYRFTNSGSSDCYITQFVLGGRIAKKTADLYYRAKDDSSVTAYQERPLLVENNFIQDESWAETYAQMILDDFSEPENLQVITVRAMTSLQLGDLISWQGRYWRLFNIRNILDPTSGYLQELTLLQRNIVSYFRIGISSIEGSDIISP